MLLLAIECTFSSRKHRELDVEQQSNNKEELKFPMGKKESERVKLTRAQDIRFLLQQHSNVRTSTWPYQMFH